MKRELALRIVNLNELIHEQEMDLATLKGTVKDLKERRDGLILELVMLVTEGEE